MLVPNGPTYIYFFLAFSCEMVGCTRPKVKCIFVFSLLNHKIEKFKIITVALGQMERFICIGNYE